MNLDFPQRVSGVGLISIRQDKTNQYGGYTNFSQCGSPPPHESVVLDVLDSPQEVTIYLMDKINTIT